MFRDGLGVTLCVCAMSCFACLPAFLSLAPPHLCSHRLASTPLCSNVWLTSEQHLDVNFNPASLLSIGDALAFMRTAQGEPSGG